MKRIFLLLTFFSSLALAEPTTSPESWVVQDIVCSGNENTSCERIKREIYLSPGDKVKEVEIQNAKFRLGLLGLFKKVDIELKKGAEPGKIIISVNVVEENNIFTELWTGTRITSLRTSQRTGGTVGNRNLFGKGKILELNLDTRSALSGQLNQVLFTRLQYTDPHFFESERYFLIAGASHYASDFHNYTYYKNIYERKDVIGHVANENLDLTLGRRIGSFGFISAGYRYNWSSFRDNDYYHNHYGDDETYWHDDLTLTFGENSEDDIYFPTRGSRYAIGYEYPLRIGVPLSSSDIFISSEIIWRLSAQDYLTLQVGRDPREISNPLAYDDMPIGLKYSRDIKTSHDGDIQNGRWYVTPGIAYYALGARAGVRLESKTLGIIDLYAFGVK